MINIKNDFLLPFYENYKTNKIIDQKIQELCSKEAKTIDLSKLACAGDLSKVSLKIIKTIYEKNLERKKTIEDKAKINVLGVTLFVSAMTSVSTNVIKIYTIFPDNVIRMIFYVFGMLAVFYIIYGGIMAISVLMNRNKIYLFDESDGILPQMVQKKIYAQNIDLNVYSNLIRTNYISSSYQCIRTGIIFLLIVFAVGLYPGFYAINSQQDDTIKILNQKINCLDSRLQILETDVNQFRRYE